MAPFIWQFFSILSKILSLNLIWCYGGQIQLQRAGAECVTHGESLEEHVGYGHHSPGIGIQIVPEYPESCEIRMTEES